MLGIYVQVANEKSKLVIAPACFYYFFLLTDASFSFSFKRADDSIDEKFLNVF